jgi:hypothetical protein
LENPPCDHHKTPFHGKLMTTLLQNDKTTANLPF